MTTKLKGYPAQLNVDYSAKSDRLTVFFRLFLVIPILIIFGMLVDSTANGNESVQNSRLFMTSGFVIAPTLFMILIRSKYPRWWFDWNLNLTQFANRILAYMLLLRDEYPSTDEQQSVHISIVYPDAAKDLNRWLPLVKWFLVIPHAIVLALLWSVVIVCTLIAWFVILFTATFPKGLFDLTVGVMRWSLRVVAYSLLLTTDQYPPFRLTE